MITAFAQQQTLAGELVRLEPLGVEHFDGERAMLADEEAKHLTGSHGKFTEQQVRNWLTAVRQAKDRADWAIVRPTDGAFLGEVVLNELDENNRSVNFRIALGGLEPVRGKGYGTEATRLVIAYAFDEAGLHRVSLEVFDFNPRAQRVYEKCGFQAEGTHRDALWWDGAWHSSISMAVLSTDSR